jgi:hypothetical protein
VEPRLRSLSSTRLGRASLTAFLLLTLVTIVTESLPASPLPRLLSNVTDPYSNAVGLNQSWDLFAPNLRPQSSTFEARLLHVDGSVTTWRVPRGGPLVDAYWDYRWRKWSQILANRIGLWEATASWLARRESERGRPLKEVTLIARWRDLRAPGVMPETGPRRSNAFYSWRPASRHGVGG